MNKKIFISFLAVFAILGIAAFVGSMKRGGSYFTTASQVPGARGPLSDSMDFVTEEESVDFGIAASASTKNMRSVRAPSPLPPIDQDGSVAVDVDPAERLIIKNGSLGIVVNDVRVSAKVIQTFAKENNGFVVSSNIYENDDAPNATVRIRIPSEAFERAISSAQGLGTVEHENISGRDVTEEFVDLDAQLGNYKATEVQFLSIMSRATDIRDILAVQRELTQVRGQIERVEGRMKYLSESAAFSTLTVDLSTDPEGLPVIDEGDEWKPVVVIKDAVRGLIELAQRVMEIFIWILVYAPVWLLILLVVWIIRKRQKRVSDM